MPSIDHFVSWKLNSTNQYAVPFSWKWFPNIQQFLWHFHLKRLNPLDRRFGLVECIVGIYSHQRELIAKPFRSFENIQMKFYSRVVCFGSFASQVSKNAAPKLKTRRNAISWHIVWIELLIKCALYKNGCMSAITARVRPFYKQMY